MNKKEFQNYAKRHRNISGSKLHEYESRLYSMTRAVIEERPTPFREIDVFSRLIMDRIIFLGAEVEENIANIIVAQLLFLESTDPKRDVFLYINSPGGSVYAGLSIYDTMQYVKPDINTICSGLAASFGAVLLAGGAKGKRSALPHARVMIHQPLGGTKGQVSDMEITLNQFLGLKKDLYKILAKHTGKTIEDIENHSDRDYWMKSTEAKEYGIIDSVLVESV